MIKLPGSAALVDPSRVISIQPLSSESVELVLDGPHSYKIKNITPDELVACLGLTVTTTDPDEFITYLRLPRALINDVIHRSGALSPQQAIRRILEEYIK